MIKLTWDKFEETFKPRKNPLVEDSAWSGCMLETYGEEEALALNHDTTFVWTILDAEGKIILVSGKHWVNRLGYIITANPHHNRDIEVTE